MGLAENLVEQGRLAGAEEAGEHGDGDAVFDFHANNAVNAETAVFVGRTRIISVSGGGNSSCGGGAYAGRAVAKNEIFKRPRAA
ncbi:hypothetical protein LBMAG56_35710 [Verrucomicrobiota bacterium]|nr:hypothetical protein LBMAG56_35710 [Verrucomicrobiota bacterium]